MNDPYAQYCREFIRKWDSERSDRYPGLILDLDYCFSNTRREEQPRQSVQSFLEDQLNSRGRAAIVVHGGFGCGKTTTAKQLLAHLASEYLRGNTTVPKALYVDVTNLDIRSRRDECIASQLLRYDLPRECVDRLASLVQSDEIQILFDGIDEMARPYTASGRREAIDILREVSNRRTAVYFVRSSYFPQLTDLIAEFETLADHDFSTGRKKLVTAEILRLRPQQATDYLESRLGNEDARKMRSGLHQMGFDAFLYDPLIVSLMTDLVERRDRDTLVFSGSRASCSFLELSRAEAIRSRTIEETTTYRACGELWIIPAGAADCCLQHDLQRVPCDFSDTTGGSGPSNSSKYWQHSKRS